MKYKNYIYRKLEKGLCHYYLQVVGSQHRRFLYCLAECLVGFQPEVLSPMLTKNLRLKPKKTLSQAVKKSPMLTKNLRLKPKKTLSQAVNKGQHRRFLYCLAECLLGFQPEVLGQHRRFIYCLAECLLGFQPEVLGQHRRCLHCLAESLYPICKDVKKPGKTLYYYL